MYFIATVAFLAYSFSVAILPDIAFSFAIRVNQSRSDCKK